jgi:hypothetical protein
VSQQHERAKPTVTSDNGATWRYIEKTNGAELSAEVGRH